MENTRNGDQESYVDEEAQSQTLSELRTSNQSEPMTEGQSMLTRRNALLTIAASATTTLAGCSDTSPGGNSTGDNGSNGQVDGNAINNLETNGYDLVVSLNTNAETNRVRLVDQEDSELSSTSVGAGVGQVSLSYEGYEPGEYSVLAVGGGNVIDEETITFDPELTITDVGAISQDHPEFKRIPNEHKDVEIDNNGQIWVTIENTGNSAVTVTNMTLIGSEVQDMFQTDYSEDESFIALASHGYGEDITEQDETTISPGGVFNALASAPYKPTYCIGGSGTVEITVISRELSNFSVKTGYTRSTEKGDWQGDGCPSSLEDIDPVSSK
jgi:hypothetical protein